MRWIVAATLAGGLLLSSAAEAAETTETEWLFGAGVSFVRTTPVDLAAIAGSSRYGTGNDASGAALGFGLRAGVVTERVFELSLTGTIAAGGLALAQIESRYYGVGPDTIGGTLTATAELSGRYVAWDRPSLRLFVGPAVGLQRRAASSGVGGAFLDTVPVGLDVGARVPVSRISRRVEGSLELTLLARRELMPAAQVGGGRAGPPELAGSGGGDAIYSFGVAFGYVFGLR